MAIQEKLSSLVKLDKLRRQPECITAVDTTYSEKLGRLFAAAVTVTLAGFREIEKAVVANSVEFDYIPTLRFFREGPVIAKALKQLQKRPAILMIPAHGVAHPKGLGMASHLGLYFDIPAIGCARRILCGEFEMPENRKGSRSDLYINNVKMGCVFRSRQNVKPIFISPGHKCTLDEAIAITSDALGEYRLPVPLRLAHLYVNKYRQSQERKIAFNKKEKI